MADGIIKKERKKNFSAREVEILVEEVEKKRKNLSYLPPTKMSTPISERITAGRIYVACMYQKLFLLLSCIVSCMYIYVYIIGY